jgi:hypothetical protein
MEESMKKPIAFGLYLLFGIPLLFGQGGTYTCDSMGVNPGMPTQVTFDFGATAGSSHTQIIVQCSFNRGFYITNFDVYGKQAESVFALPNGCTPNIHDPNYAYTVNNTPFTFSATAQGQTVTISSANWSSVRMGCGRGSNCYKDSQGSAEFTVQ